MYNHSSLLYITCLKSKKLIPLKRYYKLSSYTFYCAYDKDLLTIYVYYTSIPTIGLSGLTHFRGMKIYH